MLTFIKQLAKDILSVGYHSCGTALILAVLFMFLYLYVKDHGWKRAIHRWRKEFKTQASFRRSFFLAFYVAVILSCTLLGRRTIVDPFQYIWKGWGIFDANGKVTAEPFENVLLFVPFALLLLWACHEHLIGKNTTIQNVLLQTAKISALFSASIEVLQLIFRVGAFQIADIVHNTLGGLIGGLTYWGIWTYNEKRRKHS